MKIAILGTRGIPARYGGFETFAEQLSTRLVQRGFAVTVFGRRCFGEKTESENISGVEVRRSPTFFHKYLETPVASLTSMLAIRRREFDAVVLCNAANSPFAWLLRLKGIPVFINVDGIERNRTKWNFLGKAWYRLGEWCSCLFATRVIADAKVIADYYIETYRINPVVIAYGAEAQVAKDRSVLDHFDLKAKQYILYVSRFEPENNALGVIQAYNLLQTSIPLVLVGDAPYASDYKEKLRATAQQCSANSRVVFTGYQFGDAYHTLQSNCLVYIQATEVGGTHPALIESMAHGNAILANGTPENIEVLEECGVIYPKNNFIKLADELAKLLPDEHLRGRLGKKAQSKAKIHYSWEAITDEYQKLLNPSLPLKTAAKKDSPTEESAVGGF